MIDDQGRFYKPYQSDARNMREAAFYMMMWGREGCDPQPTSSAAAAAATEGNAVEDAPWGTGEVYGPYQGSVLRPEDILGLKPFVPKFFGVTEHDGRRFVIMEDLCSIYKQPCIMDVKLGFNTVYEWADDRYKEKRIAKDAATTLSSTGMSIAGLQHYDPSTKEIVKKDRQYGRTLTKEDIEVPFRLFAGNGSLGAKKLYLGPGGVVEHVTKLRDWFVAQRTFLFFQASVLLTYEGSASTIEEAKLQVRYIDFAHTFPSGGKADDNVRAAMDSLLSVLTRVGNEDSP